MKCKLLLVTCSLTLTAGFCQVYTPSGTVQAVTNGTNNLGVGTSAPVNPIQIEGTLPELNLLVWNKGTNGARTYLSSFPGKSSIQSDKDFTIRTNFGGWADRFILTNTGNVGIGTTPKVLLDIGSRGGAVFRIHPGTNTSVNYSSLGHHDLLMGSFLKDGLSNAFISTGYLQDPRRKFHIGSASSGDFNVAAFLPHFTVTSGGNVGIGTVDPDAKLTVAGNIHSREVKVTINAGADFVFNDDYKPISLTELEKFIREKRHLPEIQSATEMEKEGLELGKMDIKLLQKIEEMTLYIIGINKEMELLKKENEELKKAINDNSNSEASKLEEILSRLEQLERGQKEQK